MDRVHSARLRRWRRGLQRHSPTVHSKLIRGGHRAWPAADGVQATPVMWLGIAVIMLIPIVMIVLTLTVDYPAIQWLNIIAAIGLVVFNLAGLPNKGAYDNFLIVVSLVFNALTVW